MQGLRLLMISRNDILGEIERGHADMLFRRLATLTRQGIHLLVTAPQPEQWTGEHGSPDDALLGPDSIRRRLTDAGGKLDGVYYVRRSLLTQRRNREDALRDILRRYGTAPEQCTLLSSRRKFMEVAVELGIHGLLLDRNRSLLQALEQMVEQETRPGATTSP